MPSPSFDHDEVIARLGEVFRHYGYHGASLSRITQATGLGKGSLYNAFPGGKEDMANAVLGSIDDWFSNTVFSVLEQQGDPAAAFATMFEAVRHYFHSGQRICLMGAFAMDDSHDRFPEQISGYFGRWCDAMAACLMRGGLKQAHAQRLARETLVAIQGGLVLARGLDHPDAFMEAVAHQEAKITALLSARQRAG